VKKRVYFLTGATGTVGSEVLKELSADKFNLVYCLIRNHGTKEHTERLADLWREIGYPTDTRNIISLSGDIRSSCLGLSPKMYDELSHNITHIIHCAADIRFTNVLEELKLTNIEGTRNILEFAQACKTNNSSFFCLSYISSAYIAGKKGVTVGENELIVAQEFHNNYEKTKSEAEQLVRSYIEKGIPAIIFRPAIIFGSSETGKLLESNVLYPFLLILSKIDVPYILPYVKNPWLDIVPVDFVAKAICHISLDSRNLSRCFHLAAGPMMSIKKNYLMKTMIREMTGKNVVYIPEWLWKVIVNLFPGARKNTRKLTRMNNLLGYDGYSKTATPLFSVANTEDALKGTDIGIRWKVDEYIRGCVNYYKTQENN